MKVSQIMTTDVESCSGSTDLANAALIMWRKDCGIVPVIDPADRRVIGVITDRDICMAVATRHQRPDEIPVDSVISGRVYTVKPEDDLKVAVDLFGTHRVRRLPVIDLDGRLVGVLSVMDLARVASAQPNRSKAPIAAEEIVGILQAIGTIAEARQTATPRAARV